MPLIPDVVALQKTLSALPVSTFRPGETVLAAGSSTGRLLVLRQGVVEVIRDGAQIAKVSEPGAVFGELAVLLDKPHTADVRALERSEFGVADATTLLTHNPVAMIYVATILARRLDSANAALMEIKSQLKSGKPYGMITKTVESVEELLSAGGLRRLYPYDPSAFPTR
jgi:CRP/FNR family transcriptional regulator, cyclic AMP receptor protein